MKKLSAALSLAALFLLLITGGLYTYYLKRIKIGLREVEVESETSAVTLGRLTMEIPSVLTVKAYESEIMFHEPSSSPTGQTYRLTLVERPVGVEDGARDSGVFQPDLLSDIPAYKKYSHHLELSPPADFKLPFRAVALAGGSDYQRLIEYHVAVGFSGYNLHLKFNHNFDADEYNLDPGFHSQIVAGQLNAIYGPIYSVRDSETSCEEKALFSRFGCLKQNPAAYWIKQNIRLSDFEGYFSSMVMTNGDCSPVGDRFCEKQVYDAYDNMNEEANSLGYKMIRAC